MRGVSVKEDLLCVKYLIAALADPLGTLLKAS